ncbi:hypothetical protein ACFVWF_12045 [Rhodococcus qingshengii]|uniref:hypothetical protein n=2 Tax=Nocardiaceae TaxID=85025 RepID=UPI001071870D|nr:hypothetical protein [Rhodococcus qingshengii]
MAAPFRTRPMGVRGRLLGMSASLVGTARREVEACLTSRRYPERGRIDIVCSTDDKDATPAFDHGTKEFFCNQS